MRDEDLDSAPFVSAATHPIDKYRVTVDLNVVCKELGKLSLFLISNVIKVERQGEKRGTKYRTMNMEQSV